MRASLSSFVLQNPARACLLILCVAAAHATAAAQQSSPASPPSMAEITDAETNAPQPANSSQATALANPATILRDAKVIYVRKESVFFKPAELENELLKRPEFQRWGLLITRTEADADLIIEVGRKVFTRFVYTVIDRRTNTVVASGKLSSLGGTLSTKIAKRFIENMKRVRQ